MIKKRAAALPTNHPTPAERAERDRIAEVARKAAEAKAQAASHVRENG